MIKQNWYDYFKILQQLGRIWIKKSLVFIINGAWACSYKCFGGRFQPGWSFRNKGHSRASHFPYIKSVTLPWFSHCRTDQTCITLEMPNRKKKPRLWKIQFTLRLLSWKRVITNKEKAHSGTATYLPSQQIARFKNYEIVKDTSGCLKTSPGGQIDASVVDQYKLQCFISAYRHMDRQMDIQTNRHS